MDGGGNANALRGTETKSEKALHLSLSQCGGNANALRGTETSYNSFATP